MKPARHTGKQKITLAVLAGLALGTVFLLPALVPEPSLLEETGAQAPADPSSPSSVKPSTAAEKTRYRQESQTVLAQIIGIRDRLREQGVESWSAVEFKQALDQVAAGDEQYQYGEYAASLDLYKQALGGLESLEQLGRAKLERALVDGRAAIESLNVNTATAAIELASAIAASDPQVAALAARLAVLPQVSELVTRGEEAAALDQLDAAREALQQAVALDPAHQRAAQALANTRTGLTDAAFRQHMSRGYAALEAGDYAAARNAFQAASGVRPGDPAIAQAMAQVGNRESQTGVNQRLRQAAALEAQESWQEAVTLYQALLEEDPSLSEARVRLVPSQVRAALDADLAGYIEDPLRLSSPATYRQAQTRLADARGIGDGGPRLAGQVETLERLLVAAVSSIEVQFRSDNQTEVTLFRVAELGRFESRSMKLKPGRYIVAGTRKGFRDVRVEFTITGVEQLDPIVVACEEPI